MAMHGWSSHWSQKYSCLPGTKEARIKKHDRKLGNRLLFMYDFAVDFSPEDP
jgi:hypothetical protein